MDSVFELDAINLNFKNEFNEKVIVIKQIINDIVKKLNLGVETSEIEKGVLERESQSTTGFGHNLAIPHAQIKGLNRSVIVITRFNTDVKWDSMDGEDVMQSFMILVPNSKSTNNHLKILSQLSRKMMNSEFVEYVKKCEDEKLLLNYLNEQIKINNEKENYASGKN